jgi:hypothetical protein
MNRQGKPMSIVRRVGVSSASVTAPFRAGRKPIDPGRADGAASVPQPGASACPGRAGAASRSESPHTNAATRRGLLNAQQMPNRGVSDIVPFVRASIRRERSWPAVSAALGRTGPTRSRPDDSQLVVRQTPMIRPAGPLQPGSPARKRYRSSVTAKLCTTASTPFDRTERQSQPDVPDSSSRAGPCWRITSMANSFRHRIVFEHLHTSDTGTRASCSMPEYTSSG